MIERGGFSPKATLDLLGQHQGRESHNRILGLIEQKCHIRDIQPKSLVSDVDDHAMKDFDVLVVVMILVHVVPPNPPTRGVDDTRPHLPSRPTPVMPIPRR